MFPAGRPGIALLLLRVALGVMLMDGVGKPIVQAGSVWLLIAPTVIALALCLGLFTPVAACLGLILELAILFGAQEALEPLHACAILNSTAIALLGPGAYSIDARLFGRRQVVVRAPQDSNIH